MSSATSPVPANGEERETDLLQRAAGHAVTTSLAELTSEKLAGVAAREGVDFATALLFESVRCDRKHAGFIARIDELRSECRRPGETLLSP